MTHDKPVPTADLTASRRTRRGLVLAAYLGYLVLVGVLWARSALALPGWTALLALAPGLVILVSYMRLFAPSGFAANIGLGHLQLDERQRHVRDQAYAVAYRIVTGLFLGLTLYTLIALSSDAFWLPRSINALNAVFWGLWLFVTTVPIAVLAWTEPDL